MRSRLFHNLIQLSIILFMVGSCIKPEVFPVEPEITNVSVLQTMYDGGNNGSADSIVFIIEFTDGDGDLGVDATDQLANLYIEDTRRSHVYPNKIPAITPLGNEKGIFGEFQVMLASVCCLPISGAPCTPDGIYPDLDTLQFTVQIRDRANNYSEVVAAPPIIIRCNQ